MGGWGISNHSDPQRKCRMYEEKWEDIPGHEGKYQASTLGRIRSVDRNITVYHHDTGRPFSRMVRGRILRPGRFCRSGHLSVVLKHGSNGIPVHQLVAATFIGECPNGYEVLHINGDPSDNRVCNLRYGTRTENILDVYIQGGKWRKLSTDDVDDIRFRLFCGESGTSIATRYNVSQTTISRIKLGRSFAWLK